MKCASRSTLGVVIGILNILIYFVVSIGCIHNLVVTNTVPEDDVPEYNDDDDNRQIRAHVDRMVALSNTISTIILVLCLIMIIISGLLIMGIVKRRHSLMAPWLILSAIGFVCGCFRATTRYLPLLIAGYLYTQIILSFLLACVILAIQGFIIYKIYTLYKDIRDTNNVHPGQIITSGQVGFTNAYPAQSTYYAPVTDKGVAPLKL